MTAPRSKSASYEVGYGKPPPNTRFRKGQSGNPGGRPRRTANESVRALALQEAYRTITVEEDGNALALPAIQAILRSQVELAAKGNVQAQRAILTAIQTIEEEDTRVARFATYYDVHAQAGPLTSALTTAQDACKSTSYAEAARRVCSLLGLEEEKYVDSSEKGTGERRTRGRREHLMRSGAELGRSPTSRQVRRAIFSVRGQEFPFRCDAGNSV